MMLAASPADTGPTIHEVDALPVDAEPARADAMAFARSVVVVDAEGRAIAELDHTGVGAGGGVDLDGLGPGFPVVEAILDARAGVAMGVEEDAGRGAEEVRRVAADAHARPWGPGAAEVR